MPLSANVQGQLTSKTTAIQGGEQVTESTALEVLQAYAVSNLDELVASLNSLSQFVHRTMGETVPDNPPEEPATDSLSGVLHEINNTLKHQQAKLSEFREVVLAIERMA